jgi:hypothetical protein
VERKGNVQWAEYTEHIAKLLIKSPSHCTAGEAKQRVPPRPGFYAIFVDSADSLRPPFDKILRDQQTDLLYIGIATRSLVKRLVNKDLHHRSPSSFFRSLGAVLEFRPRVGSLKGKKNQCNYNFRPFEGEIIQWIEKHLTIRWICASPALGAEEATAIKQYRPILNIQHNPNPAPELIALREECRSLARRAL